jgi:hypothetical protein
MHFQFFILAVKSENYKKTAHLDGPDAFNFEKIGTENELLQDPEFLELRAQNCL